MMRKYYKCVCYLPLFLFFFLVGFYGCGTAKRGEPTKKPLILNNEEVVNGREVFMMHCQPCHPGGEAGLGFAINNKPLPGFLIRFQVRNGLGVMPSFKKEHISGKELDNLVAYLKVLRKNKEEAAL